MTVERTLYRALRRCIAEFSSQCLPFFGVPGCLNPSAVGNLAPVALLQQAFRSPPAGAKAEDGFAALRKIQKQLKFIKGCDGEASDALAMWAQLQQRYGSHQLTAAPTGSSRQPVVPSAPQPDQPAARERSASPASRATGAIAKALPAWRGYCGAAPAAEAMEEAAYVLYRISRSIFTFIDDLDDEVDSPDDEMHIAAARSALDEAAAAVRAASPELFPHLHASFSPAAPASGSAASSSGSGNTAAPPAAGSYDGARERAAAQLAAISRHVFSELKLKHETVEWVYDGVSPGLLPAVLAKRKGVPFSIALVYYLIAQRLGLAAELVPASPRQSSTASGGWRSQYRHLSLQHRC